MEQNGKILSPGTIRFERLLPGPIERVWSYITESDKRAKWLAAGDMELVEGGNVTLFFRHADLSPEHAATPERFANMKDGHQFSGKVLAVRAPTMLSFTWGNDNSQVLFELAEKDGKVLLTLTHSGLMPGSNALVSTAGGWHTHLSVLIINLEGGHVPNFWESYLENEKTYEYLREPQLA